MGQWFGIRAGFLEDSFSMDPGWVGGWFGDDSDTLHSLCTLFLLLLHQLLLRPSGIRSLAGWGPAKREPGRRLSPIFPSCTGGTCSSCSCEPLLSPAPLLPLPLPPHLLFKFFSFLSPSSPLLPPVTSWTSRFGPKTIRKCLAQPFSQAGWG